MDERWRRHPRSEVLSAQRPLFPSSFLPFFHFSALPSRGPVSGRGLQYTFGRLQDMYATAHLVLAIVEAES